MTVIGFLDTKRKGAHNFTHFLRFGIPTKIVYEDGRAIGCLALTTVGTVYVPKDDIVERMDIQDGKDISAESRREQPASD